MLSSNKKISFNYLLGITLASAIITLSGCGGDSPKAAPDTSNVNNNGPKLVKVTAGSLTVIKSATGSSPVNSTVASGSCLNAEDLSLDTSANCQ